MPIRVAVVRGGSWGTTVAALACRNTPTVLWCRRPELAEAINRAHCNDEYLRDFALPDQLTATSSYEEAVGAADVLVMGVPSHGMRSTLRNLAKEILSGHAAASVVAFSDDHVAVELQRILAGELFRVYTNEDVVGCEIA